MIGVDTSYQSAKWDYGLIGNRIYFANACNRTSYKHYHVLYIYIYTAMKNNSKWEALNNIKYNTTITCYLTTIFSALPVLHRHMRRVWRLLPSPNRQTKYLLTILPSPTRQIKYLLTILPSSTRHPEAFKNSVAVRKRLTF